MEPEVCRHLQAQRRSVQSRRAPRGHAAHRRGARRLSRPPKAARKRGSRSAWSFSTSPASSTSRCLPTAAASSSRSGRPATAASSACAWTSPTSSSARPRSACCSRTIRCRCSCCGATRRLSSPPTRPRCRTTDSAATICSSMTLHDLRTESDETRRRRRRSVRDRRHHLEAPHARRPHHRGGRVLAPARLRGRAGGADRRHRHHRAQGGRGAHRAHGAPRRAHRSAQPRAVSPAHGRRAGRSAAAPAIFSARCASISTTSSWSTTRSATPSATGCCRMSPRASSASLRQRDTAARLGGDEFAVLVPEMKSPQELARAGAAAHRRHQRALRHRRPHGHRRLDASASPWRPTDGDDADHLLRNADLALYRAKADGQIDLPLLRAGDGRPGAGAPPARNRSARGARRARRSRCTTSRSSISSSKDVVGFEALLRWPHPTRGYVPPSEFIPLAEETGLITPLGNFVLKRACADASRWPDHIKLAVNLSPMQFRVGNVFTTVKRCACRPRAWRPTRLDLEITESVLLDRTDQVIAHLHALRALGVRISMDDFGTGLFFAQLPARLPVRQDQDRPLVRARSAEQPAHAGHRARHPRPRLRSRHEGRRRRHRDAGGSCLPRRRGLQGRPGLPVQRSAAAERDHEAAGRGAGSGTSPESQRLLFSRSSSARLRCTPQR